MRTLLTLALLLVAPLAASAYDIEQLAKDARAHHDGMMKKVVDITIEQEATFTAPGRGSNTMKSTMYRKGDRWRTEGTMSMGGQGGMDAVTLFDGKDVWSVAMGMKTKLPADQLQGQATASYWMEPAPGSKITGQDKVNGRDCWIVQGPDVPANPQVDMQPTLTWIDKKNFIWVQTESKLSGKTVRTTFSDFRKVDGYDIPYQIDVYSDGKLTMTSKIVKLETNRKLSDDLFDPAKLAGSEMPGMTPGTTPGMPSQADMDAIMKQAEAMKKQMEAMQKQQGK